MKRAAAHCSGDGRARSEAPRDADANEAVDRASRASGCHIPRSARHPSARQAQEGGKLAEATPDGKLPKTPRPQAAGSREGLVLINSICFDPLFDPSYRRVYGPGMWCDGSS